MSRNHRGREDDLWHKKRIASEDLSSGAHRFLCHKSSSLPLWFRLIFCPFFLDARALIVPSFSAHPTRFMAIGPHKIIPCTLPPISHTGVIRDISGIQSPPPASGGGRLIWPLHYYQNRFCICITKTCSPNIAHFCSEIIIFSSLFIMRFPFLFFLYYKKVTECITKLFLYLATQAL